MIITTIYRVYFEWHELDSMRNFEAENAQYEKIAEDTHGTTYEYWACFHVNPAERKEE